METLWFYGKTLDIKARMGDRFWRGDIDYTEVLARAVRPEKEIASRENETTLGRMDVMCRISFT